MNIIRLATEQDIARILEIYTGYVQSTAISFEYSPPTFDELAALYNSLRITHPWLVVEDEDTVLGHAYASRTFAREAYQWNATVSVYVDKEHHGKKFGSALLKRLLEMLAAQRYCKVFAVVVVPNVPSMALNAKFGFAQAAFFEKVGYKLNQWHNVVWLEKSINACMVPPQAVLPVEALPLRLREPVALFG